MEHDDQQSTKEQTHTIRGPSTIQTLTALLLSKSEREALSTLFPKSTSPPIPPSLTPVHHKPLPPSLPLALPQLHPTPTSPHLLATAPSLPIPPRLFLHILHTYNLALRPTPATQLLDAVSGILGFVPEPHVQLASHILGATAAVGEDEVAKVRGEWVLEMVNREVFSRLGLEMRVVRGKELTGLLGVVELPVPPNVDEDSNGEEKPDAAKSGANGEGTAINGDRKTNAHRRALALVNAGLTAPLAFLVPSSLPQKQQEEKDEKQQSKIKAKHHLFLSKAQAKDLITYSKEQAKKRAKRQNQRQEQEERWRAKQEEIEAMERAARKLEERRNDVLEGGRDAEEIEKQYRGEIVKMAKQAKDAREALGREVSKAEARRTERERKNMEKLRWLVVRKLDDRPS